MSLKKLVLIVNGIQMLRALGLGLMTILFPLIAIQDGLPAPAMGFILGAAVLFGAFYTVMFSRGASRFGIPLFLLLSSMLMVASGWAYLMGNSLGSLLLIAALGFIPPSGGIFASALEEGLLSHVPSVRRTRVFATYGMLGTAASAVGALLAGLPSSIGLTASTGRHVLLLSYLLFGVGATILSVALLVWERRNPGFFPHLQASSGAALGLGPSRKLVYRLAALFVADSTGSGIVTAPLIIYWLHLHFQMSTPHLALLFFGIDILAAVSFPLAEWISRYIGLLNTAVFTHIPSSILLMMVPFVPNGTVAAILLLARAILVEMDVPTRQSYIASAVTPDERVAAASVTSLGKQAGRAIGPVGGGWMLGALGPLGPFIGGGVIKIAYDVTLWYSFRRLKISEKDTELAG